MWGEKMVHEEYMKLKENATHGDFMFPFVKYGEQNPCCYTCIPMHWHEEMEIVIIEEGVLEVSVDLNSFIAKEGDIILIMPYMLHSFKQYQHEKFVANTILFHMSIMNHLTTDACAVKYFTPFMDHKYEVPYVLTNRDKGYQGVHTCLREIMQTYDEKRECYELMIKAQLYKLFVQFFRNVFVKKKNEVIGKTDTIKNVKAVIDYIEQHYMEPITVDELAEIVNFSKHYFMCFFKKSIGMTCVNYLNEYRLNIATDLLANSDMTIMEIASKVGIGNVSYFNRVFKSKFEVTPKQYRRRVLEK
ncbi:DNA-binding response regulator, AraC family [Lachnospiraceae bacterium KM106-2]|nr:DNA-binding response regulator, AraC family [Lachnospiraceae bacterium KM106-2]